MTHFKNLWILSVLFIVLVFSGCKYEKGPFFSLRTKKDRIVNKWAFEKVLANGIDKTSDYQNAFIEFKKPDRVWLSIVNEQDSIFDRGLWQFSERNKYRIKMFMTASDASGDYSEEWLIIKLKEKNLWLINESATTITEFHLMPAKSNAHLLPQ